MNEEKILSRTKSKRKKLIVENAYKMFLERGISATSMNDIAEACDITRRTIYNYFESKTDLLNYLMVEVTSAVDPDFHIQYDENKSGIENMKMALQTNFESYYGHITDFLFITQVRIYLSYRLKRRADDDEKSYEMHRVFISELTNIINEGYIDGTITKKEMKPREIAKLIYQSLYGYLSNITIGTNLEKAEYDEKCQKFKMMIIGYLESK
ncbi:TetR/AcrR family transcriptional regulator [Erysipelotrichaceae bacterium OttesenSCG-928-M19]|nr:TetR/AcrR family transcriptional regulator [Erysipelotrichaceae bacterium OttesenSCG-928-M19]